MKQQQDLKEGDRVQINAWGAKRFSFVAGRSGVTTEIRRYHMKNVGVQVYAVVKWDKPTRTKFTHRELPVTALEAQE
jgi:hypothetical protein